MHGYGPMKDRELLIVKTPKEEHTLFAFGMLTTGTGFGTAAFRIGLG